MAPKNKGKKNKKDDDFWCVSHVVTVESPANCSIYRGETERLDATGSANTVDNDDNYGFKGGHSGYVALNVMDGADVAEEEDFGGLMVSLMITTYLQTYIYVVIVGD
jgi:hypothetical protein